MHQFNFLLFHVLTPIFLQVGAGVLIQRRFPLDIGSLGKVQFHLFIPALVFGSIYRTPLSGAQLLSILACNLTVFVVLLACGWAVVRVMRIRDDRRPAFHNAVCLYNSGNYCIPLIQLIYNTPFSYSIQIVVLLLQSTLTNTFGVLNIDRRKQQLGGMLLSLFRMPATWALVAAVSVRTVGVTVWEPLEVSLQALAQGLVPLALVTLGAQLASAQIPRPSPSVYVASLLRLLGGPLIAWGMVSLLGIDGVAGQVIVICAGAPSAVNTVLLAIEFRGNADFASQTVLMSTLLSAITMPLVISLALAVI